jgi:ribonuclease P protein component
MQRPFRLRRSADFERLRAQGKSYRHPLVTLSALPNGLTYTRYGFITGRRLGSAVVRNRVRRLLREAMRSFQPRLRAGFDVALIARNEIVGQSYSIVSQALQALLTQAGLFAPQE